MTSVRDEWVLELENVQKAFIHNKNVIEVLRGIDLSVGSGKSLAVMGASGAGKSTLLSIMGSLELPTSGSVKFNGRRVQELDEADLCRLRNREIGFVFQFHHLLPELNALENTMMPALIARISRTRAVDRAGDILIKVGLGDRINHRVGELSGGEQQRVAIARAIIMRPNLLLADEPTGNLDKTTGEGIVDLLLQLNQENGLALVIATHNHLLAKKMLVTMELVDGLFQAEKEV
jgi:lipoprotein-releasing system ATP-binding protein